MMVCYWWRSLVLVLVLVLVCLGRIHCNDDLTNGQQEEEVIHEVNRGHQQQKEEVNRGHQQQEEEVIHKAKRGHQQKEEEEEEVIRGQQQQEEEVNRGQKKEEGKGEDNHGKRVEQEVINKVNNGSQQQQEGSTQVIREQENDVPEIDLEAEEEIIAEEEEEEEEEEKEKTEEAAGTGGVVDDGWWPEEITNLDDVEEAWVCSRISPKEIFHTDVHPRLLRVLDEMSHLVESILDKLEDSLRDLLPHVDQSPIGTLRVDELFLELRHFMFGTMRDVYDVLRVAWRELIRIYTQTTTHTQATPPHLIMTALSNVRDAQKDGERRLVASLQEMSITLKAVIFNSVYVTGISLNLTNSTDQHQAAIAITNTIPKIAPNLLGRLMKRIMEIGNDPSAYKKILTDPLRSIMPQVDQPSILNHNYSITPSIPPFILNHNYSITSSIPPSILNHNYSITSSIPPSILNHNYSITSSIPPSILNHNYSITPSISYPNYHHPFSTTIIPSLHPSHNPFSTTIITSSISHPSYHHPFSTTIIPSLHPSHHPFSTTIIPSLHHPFHIPAETE
ncbi:hypothetical protein Pcinc_014374 [Petrolisthes cinctipes]|uniref:Uncharacterized protein n=1 Tax=Petrolisthes cinctipes TaxID=88211 RepID=A0AAE1KRF6_PETCI|nr:hypothetical protein Pcinc_014374 [Petrolisthes cinctipes]